LTRRPILLILLLIPQLSEVAAASAVVAGGLHLGHYGYGYLLRGLAAYVQTYGGEHGIKLPRLRIYSNNPAIFLRLPIIPM